MLKRDEGTYVVEKVYKPGKERCWCDQCGKEIASESHAKKFCLSSEVTFHLDMPHFCSFGCMHEWVNGTSPEVKKLKSYLKNEEPSEQDIYITVRGFDELIDLMN